MKLPKSVPEGYKPSSLFVAKLLDARDASPERRIELDGSQYTLVEVMRMIDSNNEIGIRFAYAHDLEHELKKSSD